MILKCTDQVMAQDSAQSHHRAAICAYVLFFCMSPILHQNRDDTNEKVTCNGRDRCVAFT